MKLRDIRRRGAFTLIELMIVLAIIALLMSLVVAAAWKAFGTAKQGKATVEIGQLDTGVSSFEAGYNVKYIPSMIWLDETGMYSTTPTMSSQLNQWFQTLGGPGQTAFLSGLANDSKQYLEQVFGRGIYVSGTTNLNPIDWNGDTIVGNTNAILEGHQALVFFLGGIPAVPVNGFAGTPLGFSTNPANPAAPGGSRKGPFAEFDPARLKVPTNNNVGALHYFSYVDSFAANAGNSFYAFFSSYKSQNGYNRYVVSDCVSLGVSPYYQSSNQYYKPNGVQILCCGPDGLFGNVGGPSNNFAYPWTPQTAGNVANAVPGLADDQSNFYDRTLGTSQ
jgi:prepilin-type N-terminal cleavage/methylation domain-containing protein